jgi:hypothetical protein
MSKLHTSPILLSSNSEGFSIVDSEGLTALAASLVLQHINLSIGESFSNLNEASKAIAGIKFECFKEKHQRILPKALAMVLVESLKIYKYLDEAKDEFITDEENLKYENIYWRIVRPNSESDVGPSHADKWFWELNNYEFPSTHKRVKVWVPLIQNDLSPSLSISPGSHLRNYAYSARPDNNGKVKPLFSDEIVLSSMHPAPVKVGEAIIFNDSLIHGGRTTDSVRISIEFTIAANP